jgi:hypothetical protein
MTAAAARVALCWAVFTACLCVMGCAGNGRLGASPEGPGTARTPTGEFPAPQTAMNRVVLGKSNQADVEAALGKAIVISFDSGYAVWVYRWRGADATPRAATEVVVLFDPSGLATKARLRPGYEPPK